MIAPLRHETGPARRHLLQHLLRAPGVWKGGKYAGASASQPGDSMSAQPGGSGGDFRVAAVHHRFAIIAARPAHEVGYCAER